MKYQVYNVEGTLYILTDFTTYIVVVTSDEIDLHSFYKRYLCD